MTPVVAAVAVGGIAIALYAVLGGADFGGGVWDLLATGPRSAQQRAAITRAIGPVWEANHVWLIFAIVTSFTCFPAAFADVATGLYAPLSFALVGIVLRGTAFVFRNYASDAPALAQTWTAVFGAASLLAPFFLGDALGALATGRYAWTSPFALATGAFAVATCAQVAATFILREIEDLDVRADFRIRAIRATVAVWVAGALSAALAAATEPELFASLRHPVALAAVALALVAGLGVIGCVVTRRDLDARFAVALEAVAVLGGWFGWQAPALVPGRYTFTSAASSDAMIVAFLVVAGFGAALLIPSLLVLFRVFKARAT
ncbi:MAG TPA: cytochrome d ubiquinol oxidase subunit II [Candidatus Lustribacter sp.]